MDDKLMFRRGLLLVEPFTTVQKLVDKGVLTLTRTGGDSSIAQRVYAFAKPLKKKFKQIKDFRQFFLDYTEEDTTKYLNALTIDYSMGYLTKKQMNELIDLISTSTEAQTLNYGICLKNLGFTEFADKDIVITQVTDERYGYYVNYDMCNDMLYGSGFNSVTINMVSGRLSVLQNMFRNCACKTIRLVIAPENTRGSVAIQPSDMSGWCEFNSKLISHPDTIDYQNCNNISYAWEGCTALTEIPSYHTITDEASRLSTPENIIGGSSGNGIAFCDQAFNICRVLTKIGPVLDMRGIVPNASQKLPYNMFNDTQNIADIRLKNLGNGDWSFIFRNWLGLPSMNLASIKYCIENLARQVDLSFIPYVVNDITEPTYNWNVLVKTTDSSVMFKRPSSKGKFIKITDTYKVQLPAGLTMKIVWWIGNGENQYNMAHNEFTVIEGNGELQTFSNGLAASYPWAIIELFRTDGTALTRDGLHEILMANPDTFGFYVGDSTTNYFKSVNHTIAFGTKYQAQIEAKDVITSEIIQAANDKGWTIYIGDTVLTP